MNVEEAARVERARLLRPLFSRQLPSPIGLRFLAGDKRIARPRRIHDGRPLAAAPITTLAIPRLRQNGTGRFHRVTDPYTIFSCSGAMDIRAGTAPAPGVLQTLASLLGLRMIGGTCRCRPGASWFTARRSAVELTSPSCKVPDHRYCFSKVLNGSPAVSIAAANQKRSD